MKMGGWKTASMFRRYVILSDADQRAAVVALERARAEQNSRTFSPVEVKTAPATQQPTLAKPH